MKQLFCYTLLDPQHFSGRVPYTFGAGINGYKQDVILQAMEHWSSQTCLKFHKKKSEDVNYVQFFSGNGCYSDLGKSGKTSLIPFGRRNFNNDEFT